MFSLAQRHNLDWGIPEYQVHQKYLDYQRIAFNNLQYKYATNEIKRPKMSSVDSKSKRANFLDDLIKREKFKPEPWKYDLRKKWLFGFNAPHIEERVPKQKQELKFQWLEVPPEKQEIIQPERSKSSKIDTTVIKSSFIDQIIQENSKENYPKPGPGQYFLDDKGAKKFYSDKVDLVTLPSAEKNETSAKDRMPLNKQKRKERLRIFLFRKKWTQASSSRSLSTRC